jgi:hypothetical protein
MAGPYAHGKKRRVLLIRAPVDRLLVMDFVNIRAASFWTEEPVERDEPAEESFARALAALDRAPVKADSSNRKVFTIVSSPTGADTVFGLLWTDRVER